MAIKQTCTIPDSITSKGNRHYLLFESYSVEEGNGTEYDYFTELERIRPHDNNNVDSKLDKVILLNKYGPDINTSCLGDLIDMAHNKIEFYKNKKCHIEEFVNGILHVIKYKFEVPGHDKNGKPIQIVDIEDYLNYRNEIINHIKNERVCKKFPIQNDNKIIKVYSGEITQVRYKGYVTGDEFQQVFDKVIKYIRKHRFKNLDKSIFYEEFPKKIVEQINPQYVEENSNEFRNGDCMCIIHDRDFHPYFFSDPNYDFQVNRINCDRELRLYITSPLFEFWLLMHHEDFKNFDCDKLDKLMSKKTKEDWLQARDMVEHSLNQSEGRNYNQKWIINTKDPDKKHFRFDTYYQPALESGKIFSKDVCNILPKLRDQCGTNIGELVKQLMGLKNN